jgi:uncharacterized protein (DUF1684 family)
MIDLVDLLAWKRRVFELYAAVRAAQDAEVAWQIWRAVRDDLFRTHPQSPLPEAARASFAGVEYFPYDPALRVTAELVPDPDEPRAIPGSAGSTIMFHRFARAEFELAGRPQSLELYWLEGYGGGAFLAFTDGTTGRETYGGGRYLLDTVKGADLGMAGERLVLDFNFAYNPSCAYDSRWACPLAPPANTLDVEIRGGERT